MGVVVSFFMVRPEQDLAIIWKSSNISLGNGLYMIVLYYFKTDREDKANNFYKCNIRIDTVDNWMKLKDDIKSINPAEHFRTSMIGLDDDYRLFYSGRIFNRIDMSNWIGSRFSSKKIMSMDEFLKADEDKKEPYLKKYNVNNEEIYISNYNDIPHGQWFSAFREPKKRKPYGRIIY